MKNEQYQKLESFLTEVLKNRNFHKLTIEFPNYDTTGGYVAEMVFAKVKGEINGCEEILNMIIKKSRDDAIIQESLNLKQAYINEIKMYSKFIPSLNKFASEKNSEHFENIPPCYGTIERENQYIIFLENLKLRGFEVHDIRVPMDLIHVKLVLEAYAKFHALCFALNDQEPEMFEKLKEYVDNLFQSDTKSFQIFISTVQKELENAIQLYEEKKNRLLVKKLKLMHEKYEGIFKACVLNQDEDYLVIRHGDCWNNNYLFHYNDESSNPDKVMIIDWQFGIFGSPLADLCTFLFYCCSRKELDHLDNLLEIYYETLSTKLKELGSEPEKCFPKENFQKSFRKYAPLGISGMVLSAKLSCQVEIDKTYDISTAVEDGNVNGFFSGDFDEEKYFDRINGIFEFSIERGFI